MMECPDTVNTLLHEFFLWEPDMSRKEATEKSLSLSDTFQTFKISKTGDK